MHIENIENKNEHLDELTDQTSMLTSNRSRNRTLSAPQKDPHVFSNLQPVSLNAIG